MFGQYPKHLLYLGNQMETLSSNWNSYIAIFLSYVHDTRKLEAEVLLLIQFACACLEFLNI